jgi:hypothetical protein
MAERNVEPPSPIEPHHPIVTGSIEKEKIERASVAVESLPNLIEVALSVFAQLSVSID